MTSALTEAPASPAAGSVAATKIVTVLLLVVPLAALATAGVWAIAPTWTDVALGVVLYVLAVGGTTVGYHRLLTHRGFVAAPWLRYTLTVAGASSLEGGPIGWVALHRRHHQFSDQPAGDPHSPHHHGEGWRGVVRGFWHAHLGWLMRGENPQEAKYAPDLLAEPGMRRIERVWWVAPLVSVLLLPAALGFAVGGWRGLLGCALWAGIIRATLVHHMTWSVNSVCHLWGKQPFRSRDESRNVWWLAPFSLGESFHNAHHAFPSMARHGVLPHQWDASARFIAWCEKAGWVREVKWPRPEMMERRTRT